MELVKIDSEVRNALAEYLSQNGFGPEVRLRTLGIGCMGAVIDLITDSKKVDDYEMPFENFTFLANSAEAQSFGGYRIVKARSGIRIKTVNRVIGGCETCYNTLRGEGCH